MKSESMKVRKLTSLMVTLALLGGAFLMLIPLDGGGKLSTSKDTYNYGWLDSKDEVPHAAYNWIDAAGTGTQITYGSYYGSSSYLDIPFDFEYYGADHDHLYVSCYGYVSFTQYYRTTSYGSGIPNTDSVHNMIAVFWTGVYSYINTGGGGIWWVTGNENGMDYICIEWHNDASYNINVELVLYEGGLIKMQYKDTGTHSDRSTGYSVTVGIEGDSSSDGLAYSNYYDRGLEDLLAIEFSNGEITPGMIYITDPDNGKAYAENREYNLRLNLTDDKGGPDISSVKVYFGPMSLGYGIEFYNFNSQYKFRNLAGPEYILLNGTSSSFSFSGDQLTVHFKLMFMFELPLEGSTNVTTVSRGFISLPVVRTFEEALFLVTTVKIVDNVMAVDEGGLEIQNGNFTMDNQLVTFIGGKVEYRYHSEGIYPPNSSYHYNLLSVISTDPFEALIVSSDRNASGRGMNLQFNMPLEAITVVLTMNLSGIPASKIMSVFPTYTLKVDNSAPSAPMSVIIRADSFKDSQTELDNDNTLFISWSTVSDIGSGIKGYRISDQYLPYDPSVPFVDLKTTTYIWENTTEGLFTIYIWGEDKVGKAGAFAVGEIFIDKVEVTFEEFTFEGMTSDEVENIWISTKGPLCKFDVRDPDGSGVDPDSIEYSISTDGTDKFEDWMKVDFTDDKKHPVTEEIYYRVETIPSFLEGDNNWIRFRAKDRAGNGFTQSENFSMMVDVTEPRLEDLFPTQNVWHDVDILNEKEVSIHIMDDTSGIDTANVFYRISTSTDENGEYIWDTGIIPEHKGWLKYAVKPGDRLDEDKHLFVHFEFDGFKEGDDNIIQFRIKDVAGTGPGGWTISSDYRIKANTKPVAVISQPKEGDVFYLGDLIRFDATGTYDFDEDRTFRYSWILGDGKTGSDMILENVRYETIGPKTIKLYVGDNVHQYDPDTGVDRRSIAWVNITIENPLTWNHSWDSDKDGMDDLWEYEHQLDPDDSRDAQEDHDSDGYTNLQEYLGNDGIAPRYREDGTPLSGNDDTDPQDPDDKPDPIDISIEVTDEPPFDIWIFIVILAAAFIIAGFVILIGYLNIHRKESEEMREEAEEEAMLATPEIEMPAMPMPIDASIPTLPVGDMGGFGSEALPPAPEEVVQEPGVEQQPVYEEPPQMPETTMIEGDYSAAPPPEAEQPEYQQPPAYDPNIPQQ